MKKTLSKIAIGLFIVAAIVVNAFPLLAISNYSPTPPAQWVYGMILAFDGNGCPPDYHWAHCVIYTGFRCDVSAQHEDCVADSLPPN